MSSLRIFYRVRQFWEVLSSHPRPADLELVQKVLNPAQQTLFFRMQSSEQAHAVRVVRKIEKLVKYPVPADILVAALLHDVGKIKMPLRLWERVAIVMGKAIFPDLVSQWGKGGFRWWTRPFVVALNHPAWGAEMAKECGASSFSVNIIRHHQDLSKQPPTTEEGWWLAQLQKVDDDS